MKLLKKKVNSNLKITLKNLENSSRVKIRTDYSRMDKLKLKMKQMKNSWRELWLQLINMEMAISKAIKVKNLSLFHVLA